MIITISGTPGSGKSSVASALSRILRMPIYSAGDARREIAASFGITLEELNKKAESDPASDKIVDEHLATLAGRDMIVDARLGFFFIPSSIKVFIDASEEVRARRVLDAGRHVERFSDEKGALKSIRNRVSSDRRRYQALYDIDPYDPNHYDLVLDSSVHDVEAMAGQIYRFAMMRQNQK